MQIQYEIMYLQSAYSHATARGPRRERGRRKGTKRYVYVTDTEFSAINVSRSWSEVVDVLEPTEEKLFFLPSASFFFFSFADRLVK